jgi:hypothetical protein
MTQGLRIPIAWPHDGSTHDKGSGLPLAGQYKNFGANMLPRWAINHGTTHYNVEPALEEMRQLMFEGKLTIAPHNAELIEELRHYHRDASSTRRVQRPPDERERQENAREYRENGRSGKSVTGCRD